MLQPVYDRLNLTSLGSFGFYREAAEALGFEVVDQVELTQNLRTHYARVREELRGSITTSCSKTPRGPISTRCWSGWRTG